MTDLQRGFTVLELLVVTGVLAVLFGIGIGFLGRTDPHQVAASILAGETRSAQLTARAEGLPTEVLITPGQDGASATVQSRLLQPVVTWHFEPGDDVLDDVLRPQLGGEADPAGRFGHARRPRAEDRSPLLRWTIDRRAADFDEGFALRLDLWLDERSAATVLRFGSAVELSLDGDAVPTARFRIRTAGDGTQGVQAQGSRPLPLRRWCTLDLVADGRHAWLSHDGREVARAVAEGRPLLEPNEQLEISPVDAPLPGRIDEFRIYAFGYAPTQYLPSELQPARPYRFAYDGDGEPTSLPKVELLLPEEWK